MKKIFLILTLIFVSVFNFAQSEQTTVFDGVNDPQYITGKYYGNNMALSIEGYSFQPKNFYPLAVSRTPNKFIIIFTYGFNYYTVYQKEKDVIEKTFKPFYVAAEKEVVKDKKREKEDFDIDNMNKSLVDKMKKEIGMKNLFVTIFDVSQNKIIYQEEIDLTWHMLSLVKKGKEAEKNGLIIKPESINGKDCLKYSSGKEIKTRTGEKYYFNLFYGI